MNRFVMPHLTQTDAVLSYDLPRVPEKYDKTYKAQHYSEPGKVYAVNLFTLSCTCTDHQTRRARFTPNDLRIVCKHILDKLKYAKLYQAYDHLTANLLHCTAYFGDDSFCRCEIGDAPYILSSSPQSQWVNVHLVHPPKSRNAVVRFGFHVQDRAWQYDRPANAVEIEKYIARLL